MQPCMDEESRYGEKRLPNDVKKQTAMPITHVNVKGKTYYLHQGTTKTGKPKYHFAMKREGNLADSIPEGFEIYENPNTQVFLQVRFYVKHLGKDSYVEFD